MADQKISDLTAAEAATADDLVVIVDDPSGTPVTKKLTIAELATAVAGDKLPLAGGTMTGAIVFGTGGQNINVGSFDNGSGGSSGISLVCAVGYELNWQGGHLSSSTSAGATNYDILCDSSITLAATKRLTFGDATYLDSKLPVVLDLGTSSGTIATDAATCDVADVTVNGTAMIGNPTNSSDGQTVLWRIARTGGAQTVTLDSEFVIASGSITDTADYRTFVRATYSAADTLWFADVTNVEVLLPFVSGVALLLHMDGADASTVFTDSSSQGMSVTANDNAQVSTAQSVFGGASAVFDGISDTLTVTGDFAWWSAEDYTVEFWLRANSVSGYQPLVTDTSGVNIHLSSDASISVNDAATGSSIGGQTAIVINTWTHIAVVRLGGTITLYLDGVVTGTTSQTPGAGGGSLTIGGSGGSFYNGYIDELRIVKGVAIYTGAFSPPASPLTDPV